MEEGGREGGDNCVETDLNQSTPKLNAFLQLLQLNMIMEFSFSCFFGRQVNVDP